MNQIRRIALCGPPGAGKSTIRRLSELLAGELDLVVHHLRLADPLYQAQTGIYRLSGRPLADTGIQDGRLLNILGVEMRRINPNVLADHARTRLVALGQLLDSQPGRHAVVCDDMRPTDASFMRELGFAFVEVGVPRDTTVQRRLLRGDMTLGAWDDPNELGRESLEFSARIDNSGSLEDLSASVRAFWNSVLA